MEFLDKLSSLGFHLKWKFAKTLGKESFKKEKRTRKLDGQKETKNRKGLQRVTKKGGWTLRRGTWAASGGDEAATLRGWTDRRAETAEPPHAALPGPRPPSVQLPSYPAWTAALSWSQDSSGSSFQRHSFLKGTVTTTEHFKQSSAKFCLYTRQQKRKRMCSLLAPCRTRPAGATSLTNTVLSVQFPPKGFVVIVSVVNGLRLFTVKPNRLRTHVTLTCALPLFLQPWPEEVLLLSWNRNRSRVFLEARQPKHHRVRPAVENEARP